MLRQGRKTDDRRMCMSHFSAEDSGLEEMARRGECWIFTDVSGSPSCVSTFCFGIIDPEVRDIAYIWFVRNFTSLHGVASQKTFNAAVRTVVSLLTVVSKQPSLLRKPERQAEKSNFVTAITCRLIIRSVLSRHHLSVCLQLFGFLICCTSCPLVETHGTVLHNIVYVPQINGHYDITVKQIQFDWNVWVLRQP